MLNNKVYLPNLNTLRAIAAIMVVVSHIELRKGIVGLKGLSTIMNWGGIGVSLFFVLSGFLITYLLLLEKNTITSINVKDFYLRRIFRIWPLYFLIISFVYLLIPYILPEYYISESSRFSIKSILYNVFFLTNFSLVLKLTPLIISTIWSIGIEEQFYIIWPWVMRLKEKSYIKLILFFILIIPMGKIFLIFINKIFHNHFIEILSKVVTTTRFDCMAIGAFFGVLAFSKQIKIGKIDINYNMFCSKKIQIISYLLLFSIFLISHFTTLANPFFNFALYPTLFAICILNLSTNPKTIINLENKITNYIGLISYSIYLNHMIVLYLLFPVLKPLISHYSVIVQGVIIYPITLVIVFLVSHITYNFYEKQFLKLKHKFSHVNT
jgi:peptidoglycan/LPS O-acetylase OafA/YrhL